MTLIAAEQRSAMRSYIFEAAVAATWVLTGLAFLLQPKYTAMHSAIGQDLGGFQQAWSIFEIVGGAMVMLGVLAPRVNLRAGGLVILGFGLSMQFVGALTASFTIRTPVYAIFAAACFMRLVTIWRALHRAGAWDGDAQG